MSLIIWKKKKFSKFYILGCTSKVLKGIYYGDFFFQKKIHLISLKSTRKKMKIYFKPIKQSSFLIFSFKFVIFCIEASKYTKRSDSPQGRIHPALPQ